MTEKQNESSSEQRYHTLLTQYRKKIDGAFLRSIDSLVSALELTNSVLIRYLGMIQDREDDGTVDFHDLITAHVELSRNQTKSLEFLNRIKPAMGSYASPLDLEILALLDPLGDDNKKQLIEMLRSPGDAEQ